MENDQKANALKAQVREKYAAVAEGRDDACCGDSCTDVSESYEDVAGYEEGGDLKLGCGIPTEHASLKPGETVLDLGSGGGLDAFVARKEVGDEGHVIGVDMTEEMVRRARQAAERLGFDNVIFKLGEIEDLPLERSSIDVAISNCVLNLVPDKAQAFREIFRVLRSGGRFCISDIVSTGELPLALKEVAELYAGCVSGAFPREEYLEIIRQAGFEEVRIASERLIDLPDDLLEKHLSPEELDDFRQSGTGLLSVTVLGSKPA